MRHCLWTVCSILFTEVCLASFTLPVPDSCFIEQHDDNTELAFDRINKRNQLYRYTTTSDLARTRKHFSWDSSDQLQRTIWYTTEERGTRIASVQFNGLSLLGQPNGATKVFDFANEFKSEQPNSLVVVSTPEDGVRNIGFGNLAPDVQQAQLSKSVNYVLDLEQAEGQAYDVIKVEDGRRIVGLYAMLRTANNMLGGLNTGDSTASEKRIMALGLIVFDEANPRCGPPPSTDEQYLYEWAFANLDTDGDQVLGEEDVAELKTAVPEVSRIVDILGGSRGAAAVDLVTFVDIMRHQEAISVDGLEKLRSYLVQRSKSASKIASDQDISDLVEQLSQFQNRDPFSGPTANTIDPAELPETGTEADRTGFEKLTIIKSEVNSGQISSLRSAIEKNDADLKESQQTNEIIMLIVMGLLSVIIVTIMVFIIFACVVKRKEDKRRSEIQIRDLEKIDETAQMVVPVFESPSHSVDIQAEKMSNSQSLNRGIQRKGEADHLESIVGLPHPDSPPSTSPRNGGMITQNRLLDGREDYMRQTGSTTDGYFDRQSRNYLGSKLQQSRGLNGDQDDLQRQHSERDEAELSAMSDDQGDDMSAQPVPTHGDYPRGFNHILESVEVVREYPNQSQLDMALETPLSGGRTNESVAYREAGGRGNISYSSIDASGAAQSSVQNLSARLRNLTQDLLKRNQRLLIQKVDIDSNGQFDPEDHLSDF